VACLQLSAESALASARPPVGGPFAVDRGIALAHGGGQAVGYGAGCAGTTAVAGTTYCAATRTYVAPSQCTGSATSLSSAANMTCPGGGFAPAGQCSAASTAAASTTSASTESTSTSASNTSGTTLNLNAGWNLVGGPTGATVNGVLGSLFTFQGGDANYEVLNAGTQLKGGDGYWVNASGSVTLNLPTVSTGNATIQLPAGQWVMIGNPYTGRLTLSGPTSPTSTIHKPAPSRRRKFRPGMGCSSTRRRAAH